MTKAFYNVFFHPLTKFPGPKLHAASHIPISLSMVKGTYVFDLKKLHDTYGPVVRTAPNELSFAEGEV